MELFAEFLRVLHAHAVTAHGSQHSATAAQAMQAMWLHTARPAMVETLSHISRASKDVFRVLEGVNTRCCEHMTCGVCAKSAMHGPLMILTACGHLVHAGCAAAGNATILCSVCLRPSAYHTLDVAQLSDITGAITSTSYALHSRFIAVIQFMDKVYSYAANFVAPPSAASAAPAAINLAGATTMLQPADTLMPIRDLVASVDLFDINLVSRRYSLLTADAGDRSNDIAAVILDDLCANIAASDNIDALQSLTRMRNDGVKSVLALHDTIRRRNMLPQYIPEVNACISQMAREIGNSVTVPPGCNTIVATATLKLTATNMRKELRRFEAKEGLCHKPQFQLHVYRLMRVNGIPTATTMYDVYSTLLAILDLYTLVMPEFRAEHVMHSVAHVPPSAACCICRVQRDEPFVIHPCGHIRHSTCMPAGTPCHATSASIPFAPYNQYCADQQRQRKDQAVFLRFHRCRMLVDAYTRAILAGRLCSTYTAPMFPCV